MGGERARTPPRGVTRDDALKLAQSLLHDRRRAHQQAHELEPAALMAAYADKLDAVRAEGFHLSAEEALWAWWGLEALAKADELRPHEERLRERLRVMLGASAEERPTVRETTVRELEVSLQVADGEEAVREVAEDALRALRLERFGPEAPGATPEDVLMASAALFMDWLRLGGAQEQLTKALLDALGDDSHLDKLTRTVREGLESVVEGK